MRLDALRSGRQLGPMGCLRAVTAVDAFRSLVSQVAAEIDEAGDTDCIQPPVGEKSAGLTDEAGHLPPLAPRTRLDWPANQTRGHPAYRSVSLADRSTGAELIQNAKAEPTGYFSVAHPRD
jgi:hypothetical protein